MSTTRCPVCAGASKRWGPSVHYTPTRVAGVAIDLGDQAFEIRACVSCGLAFKSPFIDEARLIACYEHADADHWESDPDPLKRRFDDIERVVHMFAKGPKILDIGCGNAALLAYMGQSWERAGIEPGAAASDKANERGVEILAPTIDTLNTDRTFDVTLAIDVLEHLIDPLAFFERVRATLNDGGIFVALTGDTDARSWRLQGSRYWYSSLVEHQVFYNQASIRELAERCGFELAHHERLSHARYSRSRRIRDAIRGSLWGIRHKLGVGSKDAPPSWLPADDHMLVALRAV